MSAIVEKLEQTDAALFEHRRRLVQSEKLSAVGSWPPSWRTRC